MSRPMMKRQITLLASLAVLLVGFLGCSVDTPTAPDQVAGPPPTTGGDNWNISVSVNPDVLEVGLLTGVGVQEPAIVTVKVKSKSDNSNPANGTTLSVSTNLGNFNSAESTATSVGLVLDRGEATAFLYPGGVAAAGTVTARLQGSEGRGNFTVVATVDGFITSVTPNSGSVSGGTNVTIRGTGFQEPLRVKFKDFWATVESVTDTEIRVITPPQPGLLIGVACGDGGLEYPPVAVNVTVDTDGTVDPVLPNGFFYTPDNPGCIGG